MFRNYTTATYLNIKLLVWMGKHVYNQQHLSTLGIMFKLIIYYWCLSLIDRSMLFCLAQIPLLLGQCGSRTDNWCELFFYCVLNLLLGNNALLCYSPCSGLNLRPHQSGTQKPMTTGLMGIAFHHAWRLSFTRKGALLSQITPLNAQSPQKPGGFISGVSRSGWCKERSWNKHIKKKNRQLQRLLVKSLLNLHDVSTNVRVCWLLNNHNTNTHTKKDKWGQIRTENKITNLCWQNTVFNTFSLVFLPHVSQFHHMFHQSHHLMVRTPLRM